MSHEPLESRLAMRYEPTTHRRRVAGHDVIVHCHHYNARLQRTIEGNPQYPMLTGIAAGVMALVHGEGIVEERFGTFASREQRCIRCGDVACNFNVERVE